MTYGLIGEKLTHSFSKEIHAKIADYHYDLIELAPKELERFFKERAFSAVNVTIPYKEKVMAYLDVVSPRAKAIGAVNTVVQQKGKLYGYNTDYLGAMAMIDFAGIDVKHKKVMILGTGGTAKTLTAVIKDMGAETILFVSRQKRENTLTYEEAIAFHSDTDILINTTPVGMYPQNGDCPIDISAFSSLSGVVDVIYNPLTTKLVQNAEKRGIKACNGLYMLAAQAVYASGLFFGEETDKTKIERVYSAVLREKQNIVLLGMPSSGKSSVGRKTAELLHRPFYDSDDEIVKKTGKPIPQIFKEVGESGFRKIEQEVVEALSQYSGAVIATGGGAVLSAQNVDNLRQNGLLCFLDRSPALLTPTADRPLSSEKETLAKRYLERYPIYTAVAQKIISANGTVDEVAQQLIKDIQP